MRPISLALGLLLAAGCRGGEIPGPSGAGGGGAGGAGQGGSAATAGVQGGAGAGSGGGGSGGAGSGGASGGSDAAAGAGGGTSGAGGVAGGGGTGGASEPGDPCAALGLFLCDDFEATPVGAEPSGPQWVNQPAEQQPHIVVDETRHHSGTHAVRVDGSVGGAELLPRMGFPPVADRFYLRLYVSLGKSTQDLGGDVSFFAAGETADDTGETLRLGVGRGMLDANLRPGLKGSGGGETTQYSNGDVGAQSTAAAGTVLQANVWYCVEAVFDGQNDELQVWVDGQEVTGLHVVDWKAGRTSWSPGYAFARLGARNLGGTAGTIWYDDVAFGTTLIGCVP